MSKETYGIRVEVTERDKLRSMDTKVVRNVLHTLCDIYEEGMGNTELIVFDIEKRYIEGQIELHEQAIKELESQLKEVVENIEEQKQVRVKELKELENAWELLYIAHFKKKTVRTQKDLGELIKSIDQSILMPFKDIKRFCMSKLDNILDSLPPMSKKDYEIPPQDATLRRECRWLKERLINIEDYVVLE